MYSLKTKYTPLFCSVTGSYASPFLPYYLLLFFYPVYYYWFCTGVNVILHITAEEALRVKFAINSVLKLK